MNLFAVLGHPSLLIAFPVGAVIALRRAVADQGIGLVALLEESYGLLVTPSLTDRRLVPEPPFEPFRLELLGASSLDIEGSTALESPALAPAA